jgi:hypothetical protein
MEATCSSETSVDFHRTARRYIAEDRNIHNNRCENLKSYTAEFSPQFPILFKVHFNIMPHLCLCVPSGLFPSRVLIKTL